MPPGPIRSRAPISIISSANATEFQQAAGGTLILSGPISGGKSGVNDLDFPASNAGTIILSGSNTYICGLQINGGSVVVSGGYLGTGGVLLNAGTLSLQTAGAVNQNTVTHQRRAQRNGVQRPERHHRPGRFQRQRGVECGQQL